MKSKNIRPDLKTYHLILRCLADALAGNEAYAVMDDMALSGIEPDVTSYNLLLEANAHRNSPHLWSVLQTMSEKGIEPNSATYSAIFRIFAHAGNFEMCLKHLHDMWAKGLEPELGAMEHIVLLAAKAGHPRLALDLLEKYQESSVRTLSLDVWEECLKASAILEWKEGTVKCWEAVLRNEALKPDEDVYLAVLKTAGRHALPDLASDVLRVLRQSKIPWKEQHFVPLVEAFARGHQIEEAFSTLRIMRSSGIHISPTAIEPFSNVLRTDEKLLDNAWNIVENMPDVHISDLNVIIRAAGRDLQRAVGAYKSAPDLKLQPDQDTYHFLLEGAVAAQHPLGDLILDDMKKASIAPNQRTYELLIDLAVTQDSYEDAFYFLEEMKGAGFTPPAHTYKKIIETCAYEGDQRYEIALAEMVEMKHTPTAEFQRATALTYKRAVDRVTEGKKLAERHASQKRHSALDSSAQTFIETGGA
ncbi:hypothetical protein AAF712_004063 [Marasmius tenuissimus]|uniref:Pentatricopeptide repeat-containing protein-mitochondrial domain-containing protein n=1 Tax=Marasmius tenuissimus TaxID=585030 RepID=A0ABR3A5S5_9AGAR